MADYERQGIVMSSDPTDPMYQTLSELWDNAFTAGRKYEASLLEKRLNELYETLVLTLEQEGGMQ